MKIAKVNKENTWSSWTNGGDLNNFDFVAYTGDVYWPLQGDQFYCNEEFISRNAGTLPYIVGCKHYNGFVQEEFSILLGDNTPTMNLKLKRPFPEREKS